jgi:hypothetical protein
MPPYVEKSSGRWWVVAQGLIYGVMALLTVTGCTAAPPTLKPALQIGAPVLNPLAYSGASNQQRREATPPYAPAMAPEQNATVDITALDRTCRSGKTCYWLSAHLSYAQRQIAVTETVSYLNQSAQPLPEMVFVVEPNRLPSVFQLLDLSWPADGAIKSAELRGTQLTIPLVRPLPPGERLELTLTFNLLVPPRSSHFGYTARQMNLGDWYPQIPPIEPDGEWQIRDASAVGEHLSYDVADYAVELSGDELTTLVIAANAPTTLGDGIITYRLEDARNFVWSASPEYQVLTSTAGDITVTGYAFPEHAGANAAALAATVQALALYAELFGAYPHPLLSSVEADFPDGMEYDGLYFLGKEYYAAYAGNPANYLTMLSAHETAHQWWYGSVGNDSAREPFLDESLATYSELIFYERTAPELVDWWWEYRVKRFNPTGCVTSTIYSHAGFRSYVNAVYLRGALLLRDVRGALGKAAFFTALRNYAVSHARRQVTTSDLIDAFAAQYAGDLAPVMMPYCFEFATDQTGTSSGGALVSNFVKELDGWQGAR